MVATQFPQITDGKPWVALAPMAGITDRVFRDICRQSGADYAVSEMVASKPELWRSAKSSTRHADANEPSPRIVQLLGTDAHTLAEAAKWQADQGAEVIDLNMGCPAKKVCDVAAGSALMAYPQKVTEIFDALVKATQLPVTVKIRTGTDAENRNALEIAQLAEHCGLSAITIHGRTRADKFQGQAEYDTIKTVKSSISLPVIANGDISSPEQADFVLKYTACDGIMIGRAAQGNPWIFQTIQSWLKTGKKAPIPTQKSFQSTLLNHLQGLYQLYGDQLGVRIARKHVGWYAQTLQNFYQLTPETAQSLRKNFNQLQTTTEQLKQIETFFYELTRLP